ncbi:MAG: hypothetical protein ACOZIN_14080 [Myxococcota bacterium]
MHRSLFVLPRLVIGIALMFMPLAGCNCGSPPSVEEDGGPGGGGGGDSDAGDQDAGSDAGPTTRDGGVFDGGCFVLGELCSTGAECCSSFCGVNGRCGQQGFCTSSGLACSSPTECCSNLCVNGICSSTQCKDIGAACSSGAECCTRSCGGDGGCQPIPGNNAQCLALGQGCDAGSSCCSSLCKAGYCSPAYVCQANNDVCSFNSECCGNSCSVNDGGSGFCQFVTGGGGGGCKQDGNPCPVAGSDPNCCSRGCVDLGSGQPVCSPTTGCRITGNFCESTAQCCGGAPNPNGTVVCRQTTSRCDEGQSCISPGTVCGQPHLADGGLAPVPTGGWSANSNCCTGLTTGGPDSQLCKYDSSGIPRCFGGKSTSCPTGYTGQPGCCIAAGEACQFKDQCCNGAPCLPNPDGGVGFFCIVGSTCLTLGTTCDPNADGGAGCCPGSTCNATNELTFACQLPTSGDGGTSTDGGCKGNGTACAASAECCSLICGSVDGGPNTCQPPRLCSPENATCTASADCCTGLSCAIPSGSTTGTCTRSTCSNAGQTCSATQACCVGLTCLGANGLACSGTGACSCQIIIN